MAADNTSPPSSNPASSRAQAREQVVRGQTIGGHHDRAVPPFFCLVAAGLYCLLPSESVYAADKPKEIASTGRPTIRSRWSSSRRACWKRSSPRTASTSSGCNRLGSNKALEFLNAGSIDFGSTAGAAALIAKINGNPIKSIYVYSRPEWTALVTAKDSPITTVADLKGKRVAVTRGTDPHIFLVRALLDAGLTEKDIKPVLLQHADGKTALIRGDVDAWAGLDPMMAQAEVEEGAKLFFRKPEANTWGVLNVREEFLQGASRHRQPRARGLREGAQVVARQFRRAQEDLHRRHQAAGGVVDKQLKERTELTHSKIGAPQRDSILRPAWRCSRRASSRRASTSRRRSTP